MSTHPLSEIKDYWSSKPFLGVPEFSTIMSRRKFQIVWRSLTYRPPGLDSPNVKANDPLWFSRSVLSTLLKTCVASAIVCGVCAYVEASIRSKARCVAATYLHRKPDKYAI